MAIFQNDVMVGISAAQLEAFRQRMERDFQSKRITWNGESNVLVTTAMNQLLELASGKANIVITDELPDPTTPNTQYWLTTYDGQTIEEGRYIVMTDALNTSTLIGTSTADLSAYYTKTETQELLDEKQDILQSGVNIKTVNYQSILGSGNLVISGGGGANFQVTTLPDPDEYQNGRVVQFIGEEGTYKFGAWYACKPILMDLYGWTSSSTGKYAWTSSPTPKCGEDYPPLPSPALRDGDPIYGSQVAGKYHISTYVGPTYYYLDLPNRIRDTLATWYSRTPSADVQGAIMGYEWVRLLSKTGDYINNGNGLGTDDDYFVTREDALSQGTDVETVSDTTKISNVNSETGEVTDVTIKKIWEFMVDKIYPVGAIYISTSSTDPATLFGGTWTKLEDRFLIGASSTYAGGATGGATTVTLTRANLPKVSITTSSNGKKTINLDGVRDFLYKQGGYNNKWGIDYGHHEMYNTKSWGSAEETASNHSHSFDLNGNVTQTSVNKMPPYLAVFMWKRTA